MAIDSISYSRAGKSPMGGLPLLRRYISKRASSWDRTGGNDDRLCIQPGQTVELADIKGAGCISHIWCTIAGEEEFLLRKVILRMFWDGEEKPSVEVPVGDFFGVGHGTTCNFWSLPLTASPQDGRGFNCFFPMPFAEGSRIEVSNECTTHGLWFYYYIDYESYNRLEDNQGRFHSQWRRENPCEGIDEKGLSEEEFAFGGTNLNGKDNYVILEAKGWGHYIGCNLNIHNLRQTNKWNWYGEGDDMIFIDGKTFPPALHGTGTEDYFNMAYCPSQQYSSPYHGLILPGGSNWSSKITLYRFHIEDPICFQKSIKVTIEHGHANRRSDDYSSTAYWYQAEPHLVFPSLPSMEERLPRPDCSHINKHRSIFKDI